VKATACRYEMELAKSVRRSLNSKVPDDEIQMSCAAFKSTEFLGCGERRHHRLEGFVKVAVFAADLMRAQRVAKITCQDFRF
jgi:hypothetical protein